MFCPNCGNHILDANASFCPNCGAQLNSFTQGNDQSSAQQDFQQDSQQDSQQGSQQDFQQNSQQNSQQDFQQDSQQNSQQDFQQDSQQNSQQNSQQSWYNQFNYTPPQQDCTPCALPQIITDSALQASRFPALQLSLTSFFSACPASWDLFCPLSDFVNAINVRKKDAALQLRELQSVQF